jgi:hypothetical protein
MRFTEASPFSAKTKEWLEILAAARRTRKATEERKTRDLKMPGIGLPFGTRLRVLRSGDFLFEPRLRITRFHGRRLRRRNTLAQFGIHRGFTVGMKEGASGEKDAGQNQQGDESHSVTIIGNFEAESRENP